jgi:carboxyl-terminal processing protease
MKKIQGQLMRKIIVIAILLITAGLFSAKTIEFSNIFSSSDSLEVLKPEKLFSQETELINTILSRYHYKKFNLNDSLSSVIFDSYLNSLDHTKSYFLASDIVSFNKYKFMLDDDILSGNLEPVYEIFNTYKKRVYERTDYVKKILTSEFDFTIDENYEIDRKDADWPKTTGEANEIWRKRIKNDALNLKLAGKDWESAAETLKKRYESYLKAIEQYNSEDVFQLFMNSYTESIDPHTNYLSPSTSENFKISMTLSLEGIGAQLRTEGDYTKVVEIVPGGPAHKSNLLHQDDNIIGVAQGEDGEMVDVIGWRITDVVQLIRGPKGTVVRLQIIAADEGPNAIPKEIKIVRDKVKLEEQAAKKEIMEIMNDNVPYKIGVITVPTFYSDYDAQQRGEKDYRSTTKDVKKLINELKAENVDGLIIDLRNDGGGSLKEAIEMTGLFIKDGPVVQVKNSDGSIILEDDPDPQCAYDGPLAVLVNRFSASASEIFAGAIQDYKRGVIIGEQTYGKGTVQNLIDLNRIIPDSDDKLGQVKLTIAKYYRINGGSTQHRGVIPDIVLPSTIAPDEYGESSEKSALPWDQINTTNYIPYKNLDNFIAILKQKHTERMDKDPEFEYILEDIKQIKEMREKNIVSLNENVRRKEKEEQEEREFQRENARRKVKGLKLIEKGEKSTEDVKQDDFYLEEGAHILGDLIHLTIG